MFTQSVMSSNHLILCHPLLLLPSVFPSIRAFSHESALRIRWTEYWSFSFSISPSNEYSGLISLRIDWFDPLEVQGTLKSQHAAVAAAKLLQSCPTLCDPIDGSPPGSPIPGILRRVENAHPAHGRPARKFYASKSPGDEPPNSVASTLQAPGRGSPEEPSHLELRPPTPTPPLCAWSDIPSTIKQFCKKALQELPWWSNGKEFSFQFRGHVSDPWSEN